MRLLLALVASAGLFPAVVAAQPAPPAAAPAPPAAAPAPPAAAPTPPAAPASATWPDGVGAAQPAPPPPTSAEGETPRTAPIPRALRHLPIVSGTITTFAVPWHIFELTPPHLFPIVAVALELRAHQGLGVAVMGLAGDETNSYLSSTSHDTFYEIGVEPRVYPMGHFRGLLAGVALHYFRMHKVITDAGSGPFPFDFAGYTYGVFVGYKYTALNGFTAEVKGGYEFIKRTMSDSGPHPDFLPITDAKVGWSF